MARNSKLDKWWEPKPLTQEQMEAEIAMSQIKGPPNQELTPEAIHDTLSQLNLTNRYADRNAASS